MPILSPDIIESVQKPELFFGLVGAVGAPLKLVSQHLTTELENRGYHCHEIKLSQFLLEIKLDAPYPDGKSEYERRNCLMDHGNELRMSRRFYPGWRRVMSTTDTILKVTLWGIG